MLRTFIFVTVLSQLPSLVSAIALPQNVAAPSNNATQTLADYIDEIFDTNIAGGGTNTQSGYTGAAVVNAGWFGSYGVDFDDYPLVESGASEPAGTRRSIDDVAKRAGPSILTTGYKNTSSGAGYFLRLDPRICASVELGTWNDPQTSKGNSGNLAAFFDSYLMANKSNQQWVAWTRQNIMVVLNRFLQLVDSTQCPDQAQGTLTIGKFLWESNFVNTANGLSASFGPSTGAVLGISSTTATQTPQYNLEVGYIVATCSSILFRLSSTTPLGRFELVLLNLFAQYAANLAGTWNSCTDGASIGSDLANYNNAFSPNNQALQQVASPNEKGGSSISVLSGQCALPRRVRI